ncbi:MAG: lipid-A-disaccharide synthase [candidate division Zixibacteria bacterium]|nr:lipid-A-disaccharide synthase [candidate division Zixibacteria bacterium]
MSGSNTHIFVSAGDPSGDIAGSLLLKQLRQNNNDLEFFGLGGPRMRKNGQEQPVDGKELAVLGFWEVAKRFLFFKKLMNQVVESIKAKKPKAIILIDYPGFNLRLAQKIRNLNIPIVYYVSPQIWAWNSGRIKKIKQLVDLMLLILPFETKLYDDAKLNNKFVGHYLFDDINPKFIKAPYNNNSNLILLMPGSRPQEVQRMLPTMVETAKYLSQSGNWKFVIAGVKSDIDYFSYIKNSSVPIDIIFGRTRELIAESRLVITSSGTATLETGIIGRPMVVIYKTGWLTYQIAKRLVKLDKIALINIVGGKLMVPELIQNNASPENILNTAAQFLDNKKHTEQTIEKLNKTTNTLGGSGTSDRAAKAIMELLNC